jgi:hypothetical protein
MLDMLVTGFAWRRQKNEVQAVFRRAVCDVGVAKVEEEKRTPKKWFCLAVAYICQRYCLTRARGEKETENI